MKNTLVKEIETLLENKQIPFMEISCLQTNHLIIKVYFPKIIKNLCQFLDKKFLLLNKEDLLIRKDKEGFYKVELCLIYKKEKLNITIHSMLENTWGIADNY